MRQETQFIGLLDKPAPIKIEINLSDYETLVRKASLFDELMAGHIKLVEKEKKENE